MRINLLGAGVSGLTTGVVLAESGHEVTILAAEVANTTSHAAAAIWLPYHIASRKVDEWALATRDVLTRLADEPGTGVSLIDFDVFDEPRPACVENECLPIDGGGFRVRVPLMDTTRYLPYLRARLEGAGGRVVVREVRPEELAGLEGDLIVNCTGFGARRLFGDRRLRPGHGMAVVVPRPPIDYALVRAAPAEDRLIYVIPRTDDCLLGGYDRPVGAPDEEAEAIVARCRAAVPAVSGEILEVRRGIRPVRAPVRVGKGTAGGRAVIHNYGHGGAGFTVSWGCAGEVGRVLREMAKTAR
jgi:D-amino-acid oxidase